MTLLAQTTAATPMIKRIVVLGDSLTEGYHLSRSQAFPALLQNKLLELGYRDIQVINAGISGTTTASGPSRFAQLLQNSKPDLLILALGANDGLRGISVVQAKQNLAQVIESAQRQQIPVLLVGMRMRGLTYYGPDYPGQFEKIFSDLAQSYKVPLIPYLLEGVAGDPTLNLPDGLHPNEKGHAIMTQTVLKYVLPLLKSPQ